jgi:hypothetical protein
MEFTILQVLKNREHHQLLLDNILRNQARQCFFDLLPEMVQSGVPAQP